MKKNLLSMLMLGAAMLFACCAPNDNPAAGGAAGNGINVTVGEVTHNSAEINVDAPADMYYFASIWSKAEIDEYAQGEAQAIADMVLQYMLDYVAEYNTATSSNETLTSFWLNDGIFQGSVAITATDLRPSTEYIVLYAGVNDQGFSTALAQTSFTTTARPAGTTVTLNPFMGTVECLGDYYELGANTIYVALYGETAQGYMATLSLELNTATNNHDGVGTYTADTNYEGAPNTFLPGMYQRGDLYFSSYIVMDYMTETLVEADALVDGSFTVSREGSNCTVKGTIYGESGNTYVVDYTFEVSESEDTYYDECGVGLQKAAAQMKNKRSFKVYDVNTISAKRFSTIALRR